MTNYRIIHSSTKNVFNDKGWFATPAALNTTYPLGQDGWYVIVGSTDTVWLWDGDTNAWVDSGTSPTSGVQTVTGNIVDNTDPINPVVTQVQSDWNAIGTLGEILNKPTIHLGDVIGVTGNIVDNTDPANPVVTQVQSDWNAVGTLGEILNKPTILSPIIDIAYADLLIALGAGTLIEGQYYRITDHANQYLIPNTNANSEFTGRVAGMTTDVTITADNPGDLGAIVLNADGVSDINTLIAAWNALNPGNTCTLGTGDGTQIPDNMYIIMLVNNIYTAAVEPLIVFATSASTISNNAQSETYPQDVIEYDVYDNTCEDGVTYRTGWITYRHDTELDNEFFYDFRNSYNRRRRLTTGLYDTYFGTPAGCANPVLIMADDTGSHALMADMNRQTITLTGDGASDITTLVGTWNTNHPDQIVLHSSAGDLVQSDVMNLANRGYIGLMISDVRIMPNGKTVVLTTSPQTPGFVYNGVYMGVGTFDTMVWTGRHFNQLTVHTGGAEVPNFGEVITITNGFKYERDILSTYSYGDVVRDTSDYIYFCTDPVLSTDTGTEPSSDLLRWIKITRLNLLEFVFPYAARINGTVLTLAGGTTTGTDYFDCNTFQGGATYYDLHSGYGSNDNVFFGNCTNITIDINSNKNSLGGTNHIIGDGCDWNMFALTSGNITLGSRASGNIFGTYCVYNTLGAGAANNVFGQYSIRNTVKESSTNNVFGGGTSINISCKYNDIGAVSTYNVIGVAAKYNKFSDVCSYITLGAASVSNRFMAGCTTLTFDTAAMMNDFKYLISTQNMSSVNHRFTLSGAQLPDAGTFTLTYDDGVNAPITTAAIPFNALCDDIDAALITAGLLDATATNGLFATGDFTTANWLIIDGIGTMPPYLFGISNQTMFLTIDTTNLTFMGAPIVVNIVDTITGNPPATHIYGGYDCEIYTRPDSTFRLRYIDDADNTNIVAPTD